MTREEAVTLIEKAMVQLPENKGKGTCFQGSNEMYLGGYIDALADSGQITSEDRDELYVQYGPLSAF